MSSLAILCLLGTLSLITLLSCTMYCPSGLDGNSGLSWSLTALLISFGSVSLCNGSVESGPSRSLVLVTTERESISSCKTSQLDPSFLIFCRQRYLPSSISFLISYPYFLIFCSFFKHTHLLIPFSQTLRSRIHVLLFIFLLYYSFFIQLPYRETLFTVQLNASIPISKLKGDVCCIRHLLSVLEYFMIRSSLAG